MGGEPTYPGAGFGYIRKGKKVKNDLGEPGFEVYKMTKDLGQCTATTAEAR